MTEFLDSNQKKQSLLTKIALRVAIFLVSAFVLAFVVDAFMGFQYFSESKSVLAWLVRLLLTGVILAAGMLGVELITGKDETSDPLYKRSLKLVLALLSIACMLALMTIADTYFE